MSVKERQPYVLLFAMVLTLMLTYAKLFAGANLSWIHVFAPMIAIAMVWAVVLTFVAIAAVAFAFIAAVAGSKK